MLPVFVCSLLSVFPYFSVSLPLPLPFITIVSASFRGTLTKGPTLNEITKSTGATLSVRGQYMTAQEKEAAGSKPE